MADFVIGDYKYTTLNEPNTVKVRAVDTSKASYDDIPSSVTYGGVRYSVTDMTYCFRDCISLTQAPIIPDSVTNMLGCFYACTSLTQAPIIPSSVTKMTNCFRGCISLTGNIYVCASHLLSGAAYCFFSTVESITLYTSSTSIADELISTANNNNVIFGDIIAAVRPMLLNTRRLTKSENVTYGTTNGYRVDMLLDCSSKGVIAGITPSTIKLYAMDDTTITYPYILDNNLLRCYGVASYTPQVPNNILTISIQNATSTTQQSAIIGLPSTATLAQIKQEGETDLISPTIYASNVRFNPETTGLNKYDVGDVIVGTGTIIANVTKAQTNVDNDVKHIVTHASNVIIHGTTTLQDWITEQYNNLT